MPSSRVKNVLQIVGSGLFVFFGLGLSIFFISRFFPDALPAWIVVPLLVVGFFVFIFLGMALFHGKGPRRISAEKWTARIRELEEDGLLIHQAFWARRALQVDEFEDEGSHYFIELANGDVLFLTGQYLYDYVPQGSYVDDPAAVLPIYRIYDSAPQRKGFAVDVSRQGEVIEPEVLAPWFDEEDFKKSLIREDGAILREKSYDQIKNERLKQK